MAANASKKAISLLDALDRSFMPSSSSASPLPSEQVQGSHSTALKLNPLTPNLNQYFEAKSGYSSQTKNIEDLRAAQKLHDSRQSATGGFESPLAAHVMSHSLIIYIVDDDVADLLLNGSGPLKTAGPGGFRLNYDKETPLRQIDLGGPDQQQRCASFDEVVATTTLIFSQNCRIRYQIDRRHEPSFVRP
jgi:hypothetical protein